MPHTLVVNTTINMTTLFSTLFVIRRFRPMYPGSSVGDVTYWGNHGQWTEKTPKIYTSARRVLAAILAHEGWTIPNVNISYTVVVLQPVGGFISEVASMSLSEFLAKRDFVEKIFR